MTRGRPRGTSAVQAGGRRAAAWSAARGRRRRAERAWGEGVPQVSRLPLSVARARAATSPASVPSLPPPPRQERRPARCRYCAGRSKTPAALPRTAPGDAPGDMFAELFGGEPAPEEEAAAAAEEPSGHDVHGLLGDIVHRSIVMAEPPALSAAPSEQPPRKTPCPCKKKDGSALPPPPPPPPGEEGGDAVSSLIDTLMRKSVWEPCTPPDDEYPMQPGETVQDVLSHLLRKSVMA
ncbi:Protein of unknown function, partial [Gryllus bimaculatus]